VDAAFINWGLTVENKPLYTCVPETSYDIQRIVRYARDNDMNVRVSGYREHTSFTWPLGRCSRQSSLGRRAGTDSLLPLSRSFVLTDFWQQRGRHTYFYPRPTDCNQITQYGLTRSNFSKISATPDRAQLDRPRPLFGSRREGSSADWLCRYE
jgi:hypothetical protein